MSGRLEGKVALVTGSTAGIGKGIAVVFAEQGARVMVTGLEEDLGNHVREEITSTGADADFLQADLTVDSDVASLIAATVKRFGRLDVLVNNAGAPGLSRAHDGSLEETTPDFWDTSYRIYVRAVMLCSQLATPHLEVSGQGSVINIGSIHAMRANGWNSYDMAKGAVVSLTRSMAVSLAKRRIRVNCICPGHVIVERTEAMWRENPALHREELRRMLTRPGRPRDIGYCATYLASDEAEYVTASVFNIDGGASGLF